MCFLGVEITLCIKTFFWHVLRITLASTLWNQENDKFDQDLIMNFVNEYFLRLSGRPYGLLGKRKNRFSHLCIHILSISMVNQTFRYYVICWVFLHSLIHDTKALVLNNYIICSTMFIIHLLSFQLLTNSQWTHLFLIYHVVKWYLFCCFID